jgi:hypothetical protein
MVLAPTTEIIPLTADAHGVLRIGHTRVTLDTVLAAFAEGATAEEIVQQYPYNDICLDMLIFPAYVASKGSDHHQEAADVTGTSNRRRGVLHPAV